MMFLGEDKLLREEIFQDDIASIVSSWTGIPVAKMMGSEIEKYLNLEKILSLSARARHALFKDGEFLTNEQQNDKKFLKLVQG